MAVPRLVRRLGAPRSAMIGATFAAVGGAILLLAYREPDLTLYSISLVTFLFGMGMATPLGTAMTLGPFGPQAGLASSLLGFVQMACAAIATGLATVLTFPAVMTLGVLELGAGLIAFGLFMLHTRASAQR